MLFAYILRGTIYSHITVAANVTACGGVGQDGMLTNKKLKPPFKTR